ncbi:MAG TPA: ROK family transcriptional regulator [Povalibacter sp.]|uniref:ROK family transcriptional regulator n=1 Tax=Povalibacter sp. TaxID=1962978 RepID=UPI002CE1193B|nr:ROK family transcriptional regulator [Povalibacter sp.]HMN46020.1 ROK family transcriptional regulator [Povalibacter sp.]
MLPWLNLGLPRTTPAQTSHALNLSSYLARLVASGQATSRSELARVTGLARSTVSEHLAPLLRIGLIAEHEAEAGARGRPPSVLSLNPQAGVILVADIGAARGRLAIADFGQHFLAERSIRTDVARGPDTVLAEVRAEFLQMLAEHQVPSGSVRLVVVGLPAPVDFASGVPVRPPIMPGWDNYPVPESFQETFAAPVLVDNDVNLMALGEARCRPASQCPLLYVKASTGIGCGIVTHDGQLHRGADGAAGDIGHVRVPGHDAVCRCGAVGCIEAFASYAAILRKAGADSGGNAVQSAEANEAQLSGLVRTAAGEIGEVIAMLVHFFNPAVIVLGGRMTQYGDEMLAGVRSVVYRRALPLATRRLSVELSTLGNRAGTVGAVVLGVEHVLSPQGLRSMML